MAKNKSVKGNVSSDTDIHYANNKGLNIEGDLVSFDVDNWNADAYLIGGSVESNSPFNVHDAKDLKGRAKGFLSGEDLQHS